jgi:hypothetical protein
LPRRAPWVVPVAVAGGVALVAGLFFMTQKKKRPVTANRRRARRRR